MGIKIEIIDPQNLTQEQAIDTAHYLLSLKGLKLTAFAVRKLDPLAMGTVQAIKPEVVAAQDPIAPPPPPSFNPFAAPAPIPSVNKSVEKPNGWAESPPKQTGDNFNTRTQQWEALKPKVIKKDVPLDEAGLPWDARIHSRAKTKTSDGKWRYQRGTDDATIAIIESELRQAMGPSSVAVPPPVPAAVSMMPIFEPMPPVMVPPIQDTMSPVEQEQDFPYFLDRVSHLIHTQKLTSPQVTEVLQEFKVPNIPALATQVDLIPEVIVRLNQIAGV